MTFNTYEPEFNRYGGAEGVDLAEQVFMADSDAAARILSLYRRDFDARWRLALLGMDTLLDDFGVPAARRKFVMRSCRQAQMQQQVNSTLPRRIGAKYWTLEAQVQGLLEVQAPELAAGIAAIRARSASLRGLTSRIRGLCMVEEPSRFDILLEADAAPAADRARADR